MGAHDEIRISSCGREEGRGRGSARALKHRACNAQCQCQARWVARGSEESPSQARCIARGSEEAPSRPQVHRDLVRLFAAACKADRQERALELARRMTLKSGLEAALKLANGFRLVALAERVAEAIQARPAGRPWAFRRQPTAMEVRAASD